MTEYQNIFTRVQIRGAPDMGVPLAPGPWEREGQKPIFSYWMGQDRRRPDWPRLSWHIGGRLPHLRLHSHRDHRAEHARFGELEPARLHARVLLVVARSAAARTWAPDPAAAPGGRMVADGGLLPDQLDPVVVGTHVCAGP